MTTAARLAAVARQVARLRPDWRNPERYFEERSEIERELRAIARAARDGGMNG